ncbi:MAG TPA: insulinase family protein [Longimicrobiaceae bacterium]|nr:insulinase family protein [Longimicrobiaceae bacterium]
MKLRQILASLPVALLGAAAACGGGAPPAAAPEPQAAAATPATPAVAAVAADTTTPARQSPPPPLPAKPLSFPPFEETVLPNGLRLIVVQKHDAPVANVNLYVETGSAADPTAKLGLASMEAAVLTQGTTTRTAKQIATTIEGVGGDLSASATNDYLAITSGVLADQLPLALTLVSDVALHPTFPASEIEIARTQALSALQASMAQPADVAHRRFIREIYGEANPYSREPLPATLKAIGRSDLTNFHDRYFKAGNALLVVSGDVDPSAVRSLVEKEFGAWKGSGVPDAAFVQPPAQAGTHLYLVNRPGSVQSNILVGDVAIRPDNPDYYPLEVMNQILGGGTDSRLFSILREQHGWTYGAYSDVTRPEHLGYFVANTEVRTAATDSALVELIHQLHRLGQEPVSAQELSAAKSYLIGSFPLRIQTAGQIASQVAQTRLLGLPVSALTGYRDSIQAVTVADVQRVAREYVRPDSAVIVVVGDATALYPKLQGIAPIVLSDVEGNPIQPSDLEVKASTESFSAADLQPSTRTYQVLVNGNAMGTATGSLAREGSGWVSTSDVQVGPVKQHSEVHFTNDLTPVSATTSVQQGAMQMGSQLQYADGKVTGTVKMPAQMGGEKTIDATVPKGTLFNGMDEIALAVADLAPGKTISIPVFSPQSGSPMTASFKVTGTESVTVPAGTFQAYRVEMAAGPQSGTLWVRRDAPHVVVKQDIAGQPVSIVLQSMK